MSRRKKRYFSSTEKPVPFPQLADKIDTLEAAVVYRTVTAEFTMLDMAHFLWPSEIVRKLTEAMPFMEYRRTLHNEGVLHAAGCHFAVRLELAGIQMVSPADDLTKINMNAKNADAIARCLNELRQQWARFNRLRRVAAFFNQHLTVGAAKYYFPHLGSLLPHGHPFHEADGQRYKEPAVNMAPILDDIRASVTTLAGALLCEPDKVTNHYDKIGIQLHEDDSMSQMFNVA